MAAKKDPMVEGAAAEEIDRSEEYVDFMIPLGADNTAVFLGVNGENVRVMPGERVSIKRKFVEAYEHSVEQRRAAWKAQIEAQRKSTRALADL
ncbi:MAG: hypothetical protein J6S60_06010 [Oscillospiraceae bacterium]|nr:hypothetical protein [Oscillospiraceae bacterium]